MTIGIERVIFVVATLAAAAEIGSRWWIRRRSRYYMWPPGQRYKMLQDLRVFPQMEPDVRIEINSDGERASEVRGDEEGLFRALVAGGSSVECLALDQSTSWPGVLERLLGSAESLRVLGARKVHVGNIGRSGIAARHLELIFERLLPQYPRLSAILIVVGGSEVLQWLAAGAPLEPLPYSVTASETFACHPEQPLGWKPNQWATVEVARRLRRLWRHPIKQRNLAWVLAARRMRAAAKQLRESVPDATPTLEQFASHFRQVLRRAQRHADRVLVLLPPWFEKQYTPEEVARCWHGGMGDAWNQRVEIYYSLKVVNDLMPLVVTRTAAIADELGVEVLDLRPFVPATLENYYDFTHFTPAGSVLVAQAVAGALLSTSPSQNRNLHARALPK